MADETLQVVLSHLLGQVHWEQHILEPVAIHPKPHIVQFSHGARKLSKCRMHLY